MKPKPWSRTLSWIVACLLAGALASYLYAVVVAEPASYDPAIGPWQWYWLSYGDSLRRGALLGAVAGLVGVWLVPRALGCGRHCETERGA